MCQKVSSLDLRKTKYFFNHCLHLFLVINSVIIEKFHAAFLENISVFFSKNKMFENIMIMYDTFKKYGKLDYAQMINIER